MRLQSILRNEYDQKVDEFLKTLVYIFTLARWFGIPSYGGKSAFYGALLFLFLLASLEIGAIWKLARLLAGIARNVADGRGLVGRLSGTIFYGNALLSLIISWRLISSWKTVAKAWTMAETSGMYFPPDDSIRLKVIVVTWFVAVGAVVEHMLSMMSATGFDVAPGEYFRRYILASHGFLLQAHEYNYWLAIPIFILSKLATVLWNFQDLLIILISMGLTSRYRRLNLYATDLIKNAKKDKDIPKFGTELFLQKQTWRRLREAYVRQAALVLIVDKKIGSLVLLSNLNNFYFICLQLYLGLRHLIKIFPSLMSINRKLYRVSILRTDKYCKSESGPLINRIYYFYSMSWLLLRACSVVLSAADVHVHSKRALPLLYICPGSSWNVEIKRLKNQLTNDRVGITGLGLFLIDRQLLLKVAAAILKYELVIIQYDE